MNSSMENLSKSMDDKKALRFSEDEKSVLFSLFNKYKDVIDIKHRRSSSSQHKQIELRKCWDAILDTFNSHVETNKRTLKQIQKFWLNSKLRKRLPGERDGDAKLEKRSKSDVVEVKVLTTKVKTERTNNDAFRALVKTCKDSDIEDDAHMETIESVHEVDVPSADQYEEEHFDPLTDSYFQNEAITLKVINDQMGLELAAPTASSIVTIPAQTTRQGLVSTRSSVEPSSSGTQTAAYITYSPQTATTIGNQNIQLVKSANGNYLITTPSQQQQTVTASRNSRVSQASPLVFKETDNMSISEIQRQEAVLRLREAKMRCEVQELAKEKAREELMQLREIHRMKIKEMEMRLRNMERS